MLDYFNIKEEMNFKLDDELNIIKIIILEKIQQIN